MNQSGLFRKNFQGDLRMNLKLRQEGERVKFYVNGNSVKFYDKAYSDCGSVLRASEATLNHVRDLKAYRPEQGGPGDDLAWRELRKGISDQAYLPRTNRSPVRPAAREPSRISPLATSDFARFGIRSSTSSAPQRRGLPGG